MKKKMEDRDKQNELNEETMKTEAASQEYENVQENVESLEDLKLQLEEKTKQSENYFNMLQRTAAEFDNYKKRTAREKECTRDEAVGDVVLAILPGIDSLEKALTTECIGKEALAMKGGVELVLRQLKDAMKKLGVEEISSVGEKFDPMLHDAVMHANDDSGNQNIIAEEFRKGYIMKDRVIRHSMVKVLN